jgi:uncharacterized protein (UPF0335 family)
MTNPQQLADDIEQYMERYEAMAAEGEQLAQERKNLLGEHKFDGTGYKTLPSFHPARDAWKNAQADSIDIIRRQQEVINDTTCESIIAIEALEQIKKLDGEASVIAKAALDKIAAPLLKEKNDA